MKMMKKTSTGGAYARKTDYEYEGTKYQADLQMNDQIKILSAGEIVTGEYGDQNVFKIETRNGEKNANFNQASINVLVDAFGEESQDWVGKTVKVLLNKTVIAGKKVIVAYFVTDDWSLDEYGDLVQDAGDNTGSQLPADAVVGKEGAAYPDEDINPEDIPF